MAEIAVTVTASISSDETAGTLCGSTVAGFDHAALVTAYRSRSDGKDWWMYHVLDGPVPLVSAAFTNTAGAYPTFNLTRTIAAGASDSNYRLVFGDLGVTDRTYAAAGSTPIGAVATSAFTVPSLTLPPPSFPLEQVAAYETRSVGYPDFAVIRRADLNENRATFVRAEWRDITPEDWYEIRAVVRAARGGAATVAPSWLIGTYRVRPNSWAFRQDTAQRFSASMELEQALI